MDFDWKDVLRDFWVIPLGCVDKRVCCILFTGDYCIRRFANIESIVQRVDREALPYKTLVTLTSRITVLAINVSRLPGSLAHDAHAFRRLIETETLLCNVIIWQPRYGVDAPEDLRALATRFAYCRAPRDLQRLTYAVCQGCWQQELCHESSVVVLPCGGQGHALCVDCSATIQYCPYAHCVFAKIPLVTLYRQQQSQSQSLSSFDDDDDI